LHARRQHRNSSEQLLAAASDARDRPHPTLFSATHARCWVLQCQA
jgi:hypothetical protein